MRYLLIVVASTSFLLTGCYRITVNTGAAQAPAQIERPWQLSFAAGLIPPPELHTEADCPEGVAQVQTQRSFVNALATAVTSNIISPMDVRVICASGPVGP